MKTSDLILLAGLGALLYLATRQEAAARSSLPADPRDPAWQRLIALQQTVLADPEYGRLYL
jgi:hypothetical protein